MSVRRWLAFGVVAVLLIGAAASAPSALRRFDSFQVERVEIRGTRYLAPYDALVQSGITRRSNVFDDFETWRSRLLEHPLVLDATIERLLPATLRVEITESEPLALVRTPELEAVDARARVLPIDLARADLDLPLLAGEAHPDARGLFADRATARTVSILAALRHEDARLYSWVSEAGALPTHGIRLGLRTPLGAEVLVSDNPHALRAGQLEIALADLAARGELPRLKRIDARFHDQIVVALENGN